MIWKKKILKKNFYQEKNDESKLNNEFSVSDRKKKKWIIFIIFT